MRKGDRQTDSHGGKEKQTGKEEGKERINQAGRQAGKHPKGQKYR